MDELWTRWVLQTATRWDDIAEFYKPTGIAPIDNDTQKTMHFLLDVNTNVLDNKSHHLSLHRELQVQLEIFENFYHFCSERFAREEALIIAYDLPCRQEQIQDHNFILHLFEELHAEFKSGRMRLSHEIRTTLHSALIQHSHQWDQKTFQLEAFFARMDSTDSWKEIMILLSEMGLSFINVDHAEITELLVELHRADRMKMPRAKQLALCDKIIKIVATHEESEIQFLRLYGGQGVEEQQREHALFNELLRAYRYSVEHAYVSLETRGEYSLLKTWIYHINVYDAQHFTFSELANTMISSSSSAGELSWLVRSTGIDLIDREHREILENIVALDVAKTKQALKTTFAVIMHSLINHFQDEEKIMKEVHHPDVKAHVAEHRHLLKTISSYVNEQVDGSVEVSPYFKPRLINWLITHTNGMDYETFVLHKEVKS